MPEWSYQDRTEPATPKRRREAREKGNVPRSVEVNSALLLLTACGALWVSGGLLVGGFARTARAIFGGMAHIELTVDSLPGQAMAAAGLVFTMMAPLVLALMVIGLLANALQGGLVISAEPLTPRLSKISPVRGLQRIFSTRSLVELAKGVFKLVVVGLIAFATVRAHFREFFPLVEQGAGQILGFAARTGFDVLFRSALALLVMAVFDFAYQRYEWERQLRMTKEEVKEEYRQTEGDPLVRARIRSLMRERSRRRMMASVPQADVVITNPVHVAVALMYRVHEMAAPKVVAKGARRIAERIKEVARQHDIPIVENPWLAQMLFKKTAVGQEIPLELYQAVAEILAYVYRLKSGLYKRAYGKQTL
ncbi:MAG: flagellar biosynthesis protein FlhB [candidate division KSB1 bacterium]|nr:flagellar biosynthesis protein FlhB [candidate division KSB1 bacterium]MDZ7393391.1 flagellar biosynthesis protein FlhB [candidate division KSB1 bacterium]MDZ7414326.1 flagellar biosynthesis protein FlhB [candidate division KSB1 bacterium]